MKRVAFLVLLVAALSIGVWADNIDVDNESGSASMSASGVSLMNSNMNGYNGTIAPSGGSLGSVTFGTGALLTGSLTAGGTFSATGSWFNIASRGTYGQPSASIFTGAFDNPINWRLTSAPGSQTLTFTLSGQISGQLYTGHEVHGTTTQYFSLTNGVLTARTGSTMLSAAPEPGTMGMLWTGILGMAGVIRRRRSV